jgi:hypothetical protein
MVAVVVCLTWRPALATIIYDVQKDIDLYGHVSQLNPLITAIYGDCACGPTAAVNSFVYLAQRYADLSGLIPDYEPDGDVDEADHVQAVIDLAGNYMGMGYCTGVSDDDFVNGKLAWFNQYAGAGNFVMRVQDDGGAGGTTPKIPEWQFIYDELMRCEDVEMGFTWDGGGHWVTLTSFHFEDTDEDGVIDAGETAFVDFIDPWGAVQVAQGNLQMGAGGYMEVTYSGGAAGDGATGVIDIVVSESPEPATLPLLVIGSLLATRRRRQAH